ncbi:NACHT, LRR and PYD domains-containing protein 3-like [Colossoma macropomum]|uniref:NACHT, LRR and PYD domains-containing protein 3-like n=1 Tax=Colossoma macropomum TaxID=42526 RepID=UPI001864F182|nr:NACHT, LRR and PYD domains-containing protein 3-like [Colossoma macropomum]
MESTREILLKALEDLDDTDLERFQWHLQQPNLPQFAPIPKARLKDNRISISDRMCQSYKDSGALEIAVVILKKMNQNNLAEKLETTMGTNKAISNAKKSKTAQEKLKNILKTKHESIHEGPSLDKPSTCLNKIFTDLYIVKGGTGGVYTAEMESTREILLKALEDLDDADLERFQWHLQQPNLPQFAPIPKAHLKGNRISISDRMCQSYKDSGALEIAVVILKKMNQNNLAEKLETTMGTNKAISMVSKKSKTAKEKLKNILKTKYESIHEGPSLDKPSTYLNEIFTDLYIVKGGTGGVYPEHEVRQIEVLFRGTAGKPTIKSSDIFKARPEDRTPVRKVLTLGIAGVGKTVLVNKFILDWAEDKANCNIDYIFPFAFRRLNSMTGNYSLIQLLGQHFEFFNSESTFDDSKVLFIFDGLDESRLPLDFAKNEFVRDVEKNTTLDALITNLIMGELLPSALVWVTSRPAAASRVPHRYFNQITEIQGFSDKQKVEYFRKTIRDKDKASKIISHMKTSRSIHIMCHIPVFCWIFTTVVQTMLCQRDHQEIPTTLTGMYASFLIYQTRQTEIKYHKTNKIVLKLGRLAFLQLQNGNLIFYEEDLRACGIDMNEASVYSGVCTQIFRQDRTMQEKKCFSFVHLSIQEFLAAVYVFYAHRNYKRNPVLQSFTGKFKWIFQHTLLNLHKTAVDKALQSKNGHLDLFLRFLLGLSLKSNQDHVRDLLPEIKESEEHVKDTIKHLKEKIRANISPERSINLFYCLNELKDDSLVEEVQSYVRQGSLASEELSPTQWSALVFLLMTSEDTQKLFDLKKYTQADKGLRRLLPVVGYSTQSLLDRCNLTNASCEGIASVISSKSSYLRCLDLSDNNLQDSGVNKLAAGLKDPHCKLETLRLSGCLVTDEGCSSLASALKCNPSHLKELDLSYNNPGDAGVQLLNDRRDDLNCKLEKLNFDYCGPLRMLTGPRKYACELTLDSTTAHQHLSLSEGNKKVTWEDEEQKHPKHPNRFKFKEQVLCREALSRRSYWEVGWSGEGVHIGVAYKRIRRGGQGEDCWLGHNEESWKLYCSHDSYTAWHCKKSIYMSVHCSTKIGVFLDWEAGTLSFYNVSPDTKALKHLYTFCATFTEPLHPGFRVLHSSAWLDCI